MSSLIKSSRSQVLVVGGGMAGFVLGLTLAKQGMAVTIVDREKASSVLSQSYDGRASAIAHASANIFKSIGLWKTLEDAASPIFDIRVADGHPLRGISPLFLHYDHTDLGDEPFGYIIENRAIREALHAEGNRTPGLQIISPACVSALESDGYSAAAHTEEGACIEADLVVAADGRNSTLRNLSGIGHTEHRYEQKSIVCTVVHEREHQGVAVELFLPNGPFAMLPMTLNRSNVVWTDRSDLADYYLDLSEESFLEELYQRFGDWLGAVELTGPRFAFPLGVLHADRYTDTRLALIGDAAHAIHPIAGQGLNLGLRDVAALAELIVDAKRLGLDIGSSAVLERYERWRRFDNVVLIAVTDSLNRLFSNDVGPIRLARDLGLSMVNKMPPAKKFLMRHAMGYVGDLPRLVRGKDL
ncbi:MAG: 2-octaprenyl-6-methoxyphenyl hydroxylase [Rhodospirillaceae bacterium]|nr:2-octaprenyl-6-methoxyphenyl hydroxylase [Rhodospirillaceae bacterium]